jgi:hypothetical protein
MFPVDLTFLGPSNVASLSFLIAFGAFAVMAYAIRVARAPGRFFKHMTAIALGLGLFGVALDLYLTSMANRQTKFKFGAQQDHWLCPAFKFAYCLEDRRP